jgi:hypothetical protein
MGLRSRLIVLERRTGDRLRVREVVVDVPSFPPGPDAEPGSPVRIVLRDPHGRTRIVGSLREFYELTVIRDGEFKA